MLVLWKRTTRSMQTQSGGIISNLTTLMLGMIVSGEWGGRVFRLCGSKQDCLLEDTSMYVRRICTCVLVVC